MTERSLDNVRVFVVEDESLVTMLLEDMLDMMGCAVVDTASTVEQALEKIGGARFDIAILDVNLNGALSIDVAERLRAMRVPFVLSTGYGQGGVPAAYRDAPIIAKPFRQHELAQALAAALDAAERAP
jgi:CheY-like chemotaxis protein